MKQAKTFSEKELKQVLTYVSLRRHALRNRAMVLLTHWAGMRVGEVAALLVGDVLDTDGSIKSEIRLAPEQTKGRHARTVFVGQKLRRELTAYIADLPPANRASRSLVKFVFGEEDEHEEALYGTANHRVSEGSRGRYAGQGTVQEARVQ